MTESGQNYQSQIEIDGYAFSIKTSGKTGSTLTTNRPVAFKIPFNDHWTDEYDIEHIHTDYIDKDQAVLIKIGYIQFPTPEELDSFRKNPNLKTDQVITFTGKKLTYGT